MEQVFDAELNKRSQIEKMISEVFTSLETNNFSTLRQGDSPMWNDPLIGVAAGDDPYYGFLKEHVGPFHWTPAEAFAQKYPGNHGAGKLRVISMAFPQTAETKERQSRAEVFPCDNWLVSRGEWEPLMQVFCRRLERAFEEKGIPCVCPDLLPGMTWMESDNVGHASTWSQRHTAYAAGLGTFSLSDGLITTEGIAVRFTSAVIEADLPADGRVSRDPYGWCSRCGACVRRCPVEAISPADGHDKNICAAYEDYCIEHLWPEHIERGDYIFGCGLCQAGVPCSDHPPEQGKIRCRQIRQSDNPQLARLIRSSLKSNGLDIPGTAYYDLQLDQLYEYYTAEPEKRSYCVAVDDRDRVIGGIGIDEFQGLKGCAELQKLYVAADCREQGTGTRLIGLIEKEARRLGYERIYLETHSNLQPAKRLYVNTGYRLIRRPGFYMHETMDTFLIKDLPLT